jgi:hypothetical protein
MRRIALAVLALALAAPAAAQLYKWVDKDGKTSYSDTPPPNVDSKQLNIQSGAAAPSAPAKTYLDRDKELEKGRQDARDQGKKADLAAKDAAAKQEACSQARAAMALYSDGGRITKYNDKGERIYMGDDEIAAALQRARRDVEEACKTS